VHAILIRPLINGSSFPATNLRLCKHLKIYTKHFTDLCRHNNDNNKSKKKMKKKRS